LLSRHGGSIAVQLSLEQVYSRQLVQRGVILIEVSATIQRQEPCCAEKKGCKA